MLTLLTILFVIVCILLVFTVVITPSQEGGLASAFGGMGSESFFGTRAHRQIHKIRIFLAALFVVLALVISGLGLGQQRTEGELVEPSPPEQPAPENPPPSSP